MAQNQSDHHTPTPFLAKYASERTSSGELPGHYSQIFAMWVVTVKEKELPLIDYQNAEVELATKTRAQQESDDQEDMFSMMELATKTANRTEQDDTSEMVSLEMATKTDAQLEHDDTSSEISGMFL